MAIYDGCLFRRIQALKQLRNYRMDVSLQLQWQHHRAFRSEIKKSGPIFYSVTVFQIAHPLVIAKKKRRTLSVNWPSPNAHIRTNNFSVTTILSTGLFMHWPQMKCVNKNWIEFCPCAAMLPFTTHGTPFRSNIDDLNTGEIFVAAPYLTPCNPRCCRGLAAETRAFAGVCASFKSLCLGIIADGVYNCWSLVTAVIWQPSWRKRKLWETNSTRFRPCASSRRWLRKYERYFKFRRPRLCDALRPMGFSGFFQIGQPLF